MKKALVLLLGLIMVVAVSGQATISVDEYPAERGWQLVGAFDVDAIFAYSDVKKSDIKVVYGFDAQKQEYVRMYPNPETAKITPEMWEQGMWVYSEAAKFLSYAAPYPKPVPGTSLHKGYNFYSINSLVDIGESLQQNMGDCQVTGLWVFNGLTQGWEASMALATLVPTYPDDLGQVMLIKVKDDCTLGLPVPPAVP